MIENLIACAKRCIKTAHFISLEHTGLYLCYLICKVKILGHCIVKILMVVIDKVLITRISRAHIATSHLLFHKILLVLCCPILIMLTGVLRTGLFRQFGFGHIFREFESFLARYHLSDYRLFLLFW